MILISLHAFFFLFIYISNSHSHSHFYFRGHLLLLLLLLSPHNLFTFLPFYFFTFKRLFTFLPLNASRRSRCYIATQSFVRPDVAIATSLRSFRCIGRGKKHRKSRLQSRETHFQIRQISFCRIRDC